MKERFWAHWKMPEATRMVLDGAEWMSEEAPYPRHEVSIVRHCVAADAAERLSAVLDSRDVDHALFRERTRHLSLEGNIVARQQYLEAPTVGIGYSRHGLTLQIVSELPTKTIQPKTSLLAALFFGLPKPYQGFDSERINNVLGVFREALALARLPQPDDFGTDFA